MIDQKNGIYIDFNTDIVDSGIANQFSTNALEKSLKIVDGVGSSYQIDDIIPAGCIFVDVTNGIDTNKGLSPSNAVKTLGHALSLVENGYTIYLKNGTYNENNLTVANDISIVGESTYGVVLNGNNANTVLTVNSSCKVSISNLVIEGGSSSSEGGGILNRGDLYLSNLIIYGNTSVYGGGIYNYGRIHAYWCSFQYNHGILGAAYGADVETYTEMFNCTFTYNTVSNGSHDVYGDSLASCGGALFIAGNGKLSFCDFDNNTAFYGGAIAYQGEDTFDVIGCNFNGNSSLSAGGAIYTNNGTLNLIKSNFGGKYTGSPQAGTPNIANIGGAIYMDGSSMSQFNIPRLNINQCFFYGNTCKNPPNQFTGWNSQPYNNGGAIMLTGGKLFVEDSIFWGNTVASYNSNGGMGGAIYGVCGIGTNPYNGGSVSYRARIEIENSAFVNNTASTYSGGIVANSNVELKYGRYNYDTGNSLTVFYIASGASRVPNEYYGTAAPSLAGEKYYVGDICRNMGVTATTTPFWICTTSGSPGTWTAAPIL